MLIFFRKAFKAGVQIVKEPVMIKETRQRKKIGSEGQVIVDEKGDPVLESYEVETKGEQVYTFHVYDKNKSFEFIDERYILENYAAMFRKVNA
jgi:hypothetical protein